MPMRTLLLLISLAACALPALAERADRDQPTIIEADRGVFDELKQVNTVTGRATLNKGTLRIAGERMEMRTAPDGYRSAVVTAAPDALATFRQRRDASRPGIEEYIEGAAERIEWDEKTDSVRFVNRAQWRRLENGIVRDEITGQVITYDAAASTYRVDGGERGDSRVRAVIAPRTGDAPKAGEASRPGAVPLRPSTELPAGRK
jgi:lipopolysaccharide export system protein LptA